MSGGYYYTAEPVGVCSCHTCACPGCPECREPDEWEPPYEWEPTDDEPAPEEEDEE